MPIKGNMCDSDDSVVASGVGSPSDWGGRDEEIEESEVDDGNSETEQPKVKRTKVDCAALFHVCP